jgi:nucleolar protein 56
MLQYPICSDNLTYARIARFVGDKSTLGDDKLHQLAGLVDDDEEKAAEIILKAKMSMGRDISEVDLENVLTFAEKVQSLAGKAQFLVTVCS